MHCWIIEENDMIQSCFHFVTDTVFRDRWIFINGVVFPAVVIKLPFFGKCWRIHSSMTSGE